MLAALALALGCAACTDRNPVLAEPEPEMELLGLLQCTVDVRTLQTTCTEATPSTPGISPALFGTNQVKLASSNVAHDAETGIFRMDVTAQNLLSYAIGTPDGTTRAGLKIFFQTGPTASYYTPGDTGTVRVHNPAGYQNFTAAQQPYFHYDTILHPQEVAAAQRWEFSVPATVKSFGFGVRVFTATQREDKVPISAPNHIPARHYDRSNWIACFGQSAARCMKDVVRVMFHEGATGEERQSAIDHVRGRVVGGSRGFYFVTFPTDASVDSLWNVVEKLEVLPQVQRASPAITESGLTVQYSLPRDGTGWTEWKLNPDSADGWNWGLERIDAPYGWGCSTGSDTLTAVAVVDMGFHAQPDLTRNLNAARSHGVGAYAGAADSIDHGTRVAGILAAHGNDSTQVTGTMWRADLRLLDPSLDTAGVAVGSVGFEALFAAVQRAGRDGARVINISLGARWQNSSGGFRNPATEGDSAQRRRDSVFISDLAADLQVTLDSVVAQGEDPIVVLAAGNDGIDARWQGMAGALTGRHGDRIILVAASTRTNTLWTGSNRGAPAQIAAPGAGLHVLWGDGSVDSTRTLPSGSKRAANGTSFAAPHVAGAAGLLFSFDPRLNAAQVKQLLLDGAARGNRSAGGIPILNIRESLILAGRRAGAPLCGNRLWVDETGMYAQRDTSSTTGERLFGVTRSPSGSYYFDALHGGKEIQVQAGSRVLAKWSPKGWTTQPTTWQWDIPTANGTFLSGNGQSHSGDTTFYTTKNVVGAETVFGLRLEIGGVVKALSETIRRPHRNGPPVCLSMLDSIRTSVLQPIVDEPILLEQYQLWRTQVDSSGGCMRNGPPAEVLTSQEWYAYHPEGREAYVFVSEYVGAAGVGAWMPCTTEHSLFFFDPYVGMHRTWPFKVEGKCRNVDTVRETAAPVMYRVRLSTEAVTPYSFTGAPVTRGEIIYAGFSEDGREVLWQLRDVTTRSRQQWTQGYGGVWTLSPLFNIEHTVTCRTEYRNFQTGATTLAPPTTCASSTGIAADRQASQD